MIAQYDWDKDLAYKIMMCESGGNPLALNDNPKTKDYSVGLFQVNLYGDNAKSRPSEDWLKVPENNVAYAYQLYKDGGFKAHWSCFSKLSDPVYNQFTIPKPEVDNKPSQADMIHLYHTLQDIHDSLSP